MESLSDIWKQALEKCRGEVTEVSYNLWLAPLEFINFENSTFVLSTSSAHKALIFNDKFKDLVKKNLSELMGFDVEVQVIVAAPIPAEPEEPQISVNDNEYTFENFIVGSSNKFAHAASYRVATAPGVEYNPLFIYGRSGLGKTHLMLAINHEIKKRRPNAVILYTTGESFTNELITCIAEKNTKAFHNKYRNVDILLVDDIQFIQNKVSVQEEIFHTFNTLTQNSKQVVLTSDRPPKEMELLDERLRTRFEWGLMADIQPPDIDTRMAIIVRKAASLGLTLSDSIVEFIAEKIKHNIRQLEGIVKKLHAINTLNGTPITMEVVQEVVKDVVTDNEPVSVTVDKIIENVSNVYGVSVSDILSEKRNAAISTARQVSMYIIREITDLSQQQIGEKFGGKSHSTVHHSISTVEDRIAKDIAFKNQVFDIIKNIQDK